MKNSDTHKAIETLRQVGGFSLLTDWSLIEVAGADAEPFLQSRVTSDVKALTQGTGQESALLDRKAHLIAYFSLYLIGDKYWIICTSDQVSTIVKELETYLFSEKVSFTDITADKIIWAAQGAYARSLVPEADSHSVTTIAKSITGELGYFLIFDKTEKGIQEKLEQQASSLGLVQLPAEAIELARLEAGLPKIGVDVGSENILPETTLDAGCVSYTKGCYLGQEVIARVKAQGAPRRGLMGLILPGVDAEFSIGSQVLLDKKPIAQIKSNAFSPTLNATIALILIDREHRVPDIEIAVSIEDKTYAAKVISLPFYAAPDNTKRAIAIYDQALSLYTKGEEDKAIELLRQAIILDPKHGDSYEMLGVMLGKRGNLDEAIALMKKLEQIDPESVMAHANLSLYYVQQGDKDKAEEEKAIAMSIRMQQASREFGKKKEKEDEQKRKAEESLQRAQMFKQVLDIDAEDLLANFGLGNLYVEIGKYAEAAPLLKKAIAVKPDYTAAFLALGSALEGDKKYPEAIEIFRQGIAVASKRGDFEPMNKMKEKLTQLEAKQVSSGAN